MLSADDWVCIFLLFGVQMRLPAQGATGGWVMPGLMFKQFSFCEFSLFDTPRVSSLVVQGLRISSPTPKAQGLISGLKRDSTSGLYGISETKTNIQRQETKDEPQTNGSYKIRQIIIKIMEYTHVHIYP